MRRQNFLAPPLVSHSAAGLASATLILLHSYPTAPRHDVGTPVTKFHLQSKQIRDEARFRGDFQVHHDSSLQQQQILIVHTKPQLRDVEALVGPTFLNLDLSANME